MKRSPFAGVYSHPVMLSPSIGDAWELPAWFGAEDDRDAAVAAEYAAVRDGRGLIDRSWLSTIRLTGADARKFLNGMVTQDVLSIPFGEARRACMLDPKGRLVADLVVHAQPDSLLLQADPRCADALLTILDRYLITEDVEIDDVSANYAVIGVVAEASPDPLVVASAAAVSPSRCGRYAARDVWLSAESAGATWRALEAAGFRPVGTVAQEMHRVEAGIPAWGAELDETVLFPETGMEDAVSYTKGCYIGQEIVARIDARGHANRILRLLLFPSGGAVAAGDAIFSADNPGREIGRITSALESQRHGQKVALGYLRREYEATQSPIFSRSKTSPDAPMVEGVVGSLR